jgi:hypothetical protein
LAFSRPNSPFQAAVKGSEADRAEPFRELVLDTLRRANYIRQANTKFFIDDHDFTACN